MFPGCQPPINRYRHYTLYFRLFSVLVFTVIISISEHYSCSSYSLSGNDNCLYSIVLLVLLFDCFLACFFVILLCCLIWSSACLVVYSPAFSIPVILSRLYDKLKPSPCIWSICRDWSGRGCLVLTSSVIRATSLYRSGAGAREPFYSWGSNVYSKFIALM